MKKRILIFLLITFANIIKGNDITITISNDGIMSIDSMIINIRYQNNTKDTIYIPDYLYITNFNSIDFFSDDETVICCGLVSDAQYPSIELRNLDCNKSIKIIKIPPLGYYECRFDIRNDLHYYGFEKGHEYAYRVELHVGNEYRNFCKDVWTGISCSNYGFFKIKE